MDFFKIERNGCNHRRILFEDHDEIKVVCQKQYICIANNKTLVDHKLGCTINKSINAFNNQSRNNQNPLQYSPDNKGSKITFRLQPYMTYRYTR